MVPTAPDEKPPVRGEGQLLQSLLAHWTHEDNLYWTQIRHVLVLQLAVYAAFYAVGPTVLGVILMILAALISWFFYRLATKIQENRDANLDAISIVSTSVASNETAIKITDAQKRDSTSWGLFRFAEHPLGTMRDEGKIFHVVIFWACIALNLAVCVASIHDILSEGSWLRLIHPKFVAKVAGGEQPNLSVQPTPALIGVWWRDRPS